jgi:hypothetical protein
MGLASGEYGAKRSIILLLEKANNGATKTISKLRELHTEYDANRNTATVLVDGNVLVRSSPPLSYANFVDFCQKSLNSFFDVAKHVIVVFDEPDAVTVAKREEQQHRDMAREKREIQISHDLKHELPQSDDYNESDVKNCPNVQALIENRQTRLRLLDIIFIKILTEAKTKRQHEIAIYGKAMSSLTLDGVDARGDSRSHNSARRPEILSTEDLLPDILRRETPIGEGDLKFTSIEKCIAKHQREDSPLWGVKIILLHTIDTDALPIALIEEARRRSKKGEEDVKTVLCLREPGRKRREDGSHTSPCFRVFDMAKFYSCVLFLMLGGTEHEHKLGREAVALFAMTLCTAGCDFISKEQIRGLRANELLCTLGRVVREAPTILPTMRYAWSGCVSDTQKLCGVLRHVLREHGKDMANGQHAVPEVLKSEHFSGSVSAVRRKNSPNIENPGEAALLRAAWVVSYWHECEFKDLSKFGFVR